MPLGDPGGGRFEYTVEGLPETLRAVRITVSDAESSARFYNRVLKLPLREEREGQAILSLGDAYIILAEGRTQGADTGVYLGVRDPFEFHRRMVDDGVVFVRHPERGPIGVCASFYDPDRNILHAVERERR